MNLLLTFDDNYTQISSDANGNYFDVYMSGLEPERYYSILIKLILMDLLKFLMMIIILKL